MNERRIHRLQEELKHRLATILQREIADPDLGLVTITRVELDSEFTQCKAYWSVLGDDRVRRRSEAVLQRARGFCQREMGKGLRTRTVPHLVWVHDQGIAEAIRLDEVLKELRAEREQRGAREPATGDAPGEPPASPPPAEGPDDR